MRSSPFSRVPAGALDTLAVGEVLRKSKFVRFTRGGREITNVAFARRFARLFSRPSSPTRETQFSHRSSNALYSPSRPPQSRPIRQPQSLLRTRHNRQILPPNLVQRPSLRQPKRLLSPDAPRMFRQLEHGRAASSSQRGGGRGGVGGVVQSVAVVVRDVRAARVVPSEEGPVQVSCEFRVARGGGAAECGEAREEGREGCWDVGVAEDCEEGCGDGEEQKGDVPCSEGERAVEERGGRGSWARGGGERGEGGREDREGRGRARREERRLVERVVVVWRRRLCSVVSSSRHHRRRRRI